MVVAGQLPPVLTARSVVAAEKSSLLTARKPGLPAVRPVRKSELPAAAFGRQPDSLLGSSLPVGIADLPLGEHRRAREGRGRPGGLGNPSVLPAFPEGDWREQAAWRDAAFGSGGTPRELLADRADYCSPVYLSFSCKKFVAILLELPEIIADSGSETAGSRGRTCCLDFKSRGSTCGIISVFCTRVSVINTRDCNSKTPIIIQVRGAIAEVIISQMLIGDETVTENAERNNRRAHPASSKNPKA